jgi:hypothetical protein
MSRHVRVFETEYMFGWKDTTEGNTFEDTVFLGAKEGRNLTAHESPYRMMLAKCRENLMIVGKCAFGAKMVRPIPTIMAMGHAAGTAAAVAVKSGMSIGSVDVKEVQRALKDQDAIIHYAGRRTVRETVPMPWPEG